MHSLVIWNALWITWLDGPVILLPLMEWRDKRTLGLRQPSWSSHLTAQAPGFHTWKEGKHKYVGLCHEQVCLLNITISETHTRKLSRNPQKLIVQHIKIFSSKPASKSKQRIHSTNGYRAEGYHNHCEKTKSSKQQHTEQKRKNIHITKTKWTKQKQKLKATKITKCLLI